MYDVKLNVPAGQVTYFIETYSVLLMLFQSVTVAIEVSNGTDCLPRSNGSTMKVYVSLDGTGVSVWHLKIFLFEVRFLKESLLK